MAAAKDIVHGPQPISLTSKFDFLSLFILYNLNQLVVIDFCFFLRQYPPLCIILTSWVASFFSLYIFEIWSRFLQTQLVKLGVSCMISASKFVVFRGYTSRRVSCFLRNIMSSSDGVVVGFEQPRMVVKKVLAKSQSEGAGAIVRRSIGRPELKSLDPFLLLDEFSVASPGGFPDHPHRGFETVTYMFQGGITHQDFAGHKGTIQAGEVQWMTAGRGIVHSEMPAGGGTHTGLQLWINLSAKDKMIEPRYQELLKNDIPKAEKDGVKVTVIAGEAMGVHSPVYTRTPTMYLDFTLKPNTQYHQAIPESWNAFVYIINGEGIFSIPNSAPTPAHHILVLGSGEGLSVWNKSYSQPLRFILVGGQPLNEPVVQHGPFVMNTQAEIEKTIQDYYYGRNGFEMAKQWTSE